MNIYEIFEKPLVKLLSKMEMEGIKIDKPFLEKLSKKFDLSIKSFEKKIFAITKKEFNIGSPKQLGDMMYNELKISALKKNQKRKFCYKRCSPGGFGF